LVAFYDTPQETNTSQTPQADGLPYPLIKRSLDTIPDKSTHSQSSSGLVDSHTGQISNTQIVDSELLTHTIHSKFSLKRFCEFSPQIIQSASLQVRDLTDHELVCRRIAR